MQLGFVSAILPDCSLEEVFSVAQSAGYDCVELMCWPAGKAKRRYAGVTHVDVGNFGAADADKVRSLSAQYGVEISALGYYPNPMTPDPEESATYIAQIRRMIAAAKLLGLTTVNTFVGRDWTKSVDANWPQVIEVWKPLVDYAASQGVRIGIENCPMYFTDDEWPGGKNIAHTPVLWRRLFQDLDSAHIGLNYDPSHLVWQHMDYVKPIRQFTDRLFHIHAKDVRLDQDRLDEVGVMSPPNAYHTPKLPGMGDIDWGQFFSALTDVGYNGAVCVEVEDRAFEGSERARKASLIQSATYLRQFIPRL